MKLLNLQLYDLHMKEEATKTAAKSVTLSEIVKLLITHILRITNYSSDYVSLAYILSLKLNITRKPVITGGDAISILKTSTLPKIQLNETNLAMPTTQLQ